MRKKGSLTPDLGTVTFPTGLVLILKYQNLVLVPEPYKSRKGHITGLAVASALSEKGKTTEKQMLIIGDR